MNVPPVLLTLFLFIFLCHNSSTTKNDRVGSSFSNGPNFIRNSQRVSLNEYLVPPPPPRHHSLRSGRVANPPPTEAPGYFSKFMNWLNPFNYGSSPPPVEPAFQPRGPPSFNLQPGPPLHSPPAPLYPPLSPPPNQYPGSILTHPPGVNPAAPLNLPPNPPLPVYNAPPAILQNVQPIRSNPAPYVTPNKGKSCNPCNQIPWIPMQGGGLRSDEHPPHPQLSNGYLPPSNPINHDNQHSASHEISVPSFSQIPIGQNPLIGPSPSPQLYPGPIPFDGPPPTPHTGNQEHFDSTIPTPGQEQNLEINGHFNIRANEDLAPSGTDQGQLSAAAQSYGAEVDKGPPGLPSQDYHDSSILNHSNQQGQNNHPGQDYRDSSIFNHSNQQGQNSNPGHDYRNSSIFNHSNQQGQNNHPGHDYRDSSILNHSNQQGQNNHPGQDYRDSSILNHSNQQGQNNHPGQDYRDFSILNHANQQGQNNHPGQDYRDSSILNHANQQGQDNHPSLSSFGGLSNFRNQESNLESNFRYVTNFGSSNFNDQNVGGLNNQYSDDLSPSSSVIKNSQILGEDSVHFEESPLLDLSKKDEWPTSTVAYNTEEVSDNTLKTTTDYGLETDNIFFEDSSNFIKQSKSYSLSDIRSINGAFETTTSTNVRYHKNEDVEASTINTSYEQPGLLWSNLQLTNESLKNHALLNSFARWNDSSVKQSQKQENLDSRDTASKHQGVKRNKQVQVVIPYTSEYTPIPFQQSYGDWSVKTNFEKTQPRKVPSSNEHNIDNYVQQESRNDIRVINNLQSQFNFNDSNGSGVQPIRTSSTTIQNNTRNIVSKASNSIDVRRLQKNIDNWTIQEYSKPTTSNAVLQSSTHPYLLPSKKIPTKYLTTTEPGESNDRKESVKTYSLAGFSFNEVEHEGSASNRIEQTRTPDKVLRVETSKAEDVALDSTNKSSTEEKSTWKSYSVSISPVDKERVYVVTPQSILETSVKDDLEKGKENSRETNESKINSEESNGNFSEFEAIEKAYQVLPQAVNNLAVASTGKENIPLWGIMEHEEFASLNLDETGEGATGEGADLPVLYSGHSKVSRAKR